MGSNPLPVTTHKIPKKTGGFRTITAPSDELKEIQKGLLDCFYYWFNKPVMENNFSIGFKRNHSRFHLTKSLGLDQVRSVKPEVLNQYLLVRIDLSKAFDNTSRHQFEDFLKNNLLANCTVDIVFPDEKPSTNSKISLSEWIVNHDGINKILKICFIDSKAPMGFPTSPFIFECLFGSIDKLIEKFIKNKNITYHTSMAETVCLPAIHYTRYADDLIFLIHKTGKSFIRNIIAIAESNGWPVNRGKIRVVPYGRGRKVLGMVLDNIDKYGARSDKKFRNKLRGMIHRYKFSKDPSLAKKIDGRLAAMPYSDCHKMKYKKKAYEIKTSRVYPDRQEDLGSILK